MEWKKNIRETGLIEWVCEHGIGHPDYQSAKKLSKKYNNTLTVWLLHGCDCCCKRKDFPGKKDEEDT